MQFGAGATVRLPVHIAVPPPLLTCQVKRYVPILVVEGTTPCRVPQNRVDVAHPRLLVSENDVALVLFHVTIIDPPVWIIGGEITMLHVGGLGLITVNVLLQVNVPLLFIRRSEKLYVPAAGVVNGCRLPAVDP
jgi:hypothetical protein